MGMMGVRDRGRYAALVSGEFGENLRGALPRTILNAGFLREILARHLATQNQAVQPWVRYKPLSFSGIAMRSNDG